MSTDILLVVQGCSYAVTIGQTPEACDAVVVIELNYTINIKIVIMMRQDYNYIKHESFADGCATL